MRGRGEERGKDDTILDLLRQYMLDIRAHLDSLPRQYGGSFTTHIKQLAAAVWGKLYKTHQTIHTYSFFLNQRTFMQLVQLAADSASDAALPTRAYSNRYVWYRRRDGRQPQPPPLPWQLLFPFPKEPSARRIGAAA